MAILTLKSEIDDPKRALEMLKDQRSQGYKVWIEDESGKNVDEESLTRDEATRIDRKDHRFKIGMGFLIWMGAIVIGVAVLFALSLLAGD